MQQLFKSSNHIYIDKNIFFFSLYHCLSLVFPCTEKATQLRHSYPKGDSFPRLLGTDRYWDLFLFPDRQTHPVLLWVPHRGCYGVRSCGRGFLLHLSHKQRPPPAPITVPTIALIQTHCNKPILLPAAERCLELQYV